jgi:allene oxide cyclase
MIKHALLPATLAAIGSVAVAAPAAGAAQARHHRVQVLRLIEHADTDATTDTGAPGDSAGDILTFANPVFDAADAKQVATDQGYCIRVVAGTSYECTWTTLLKGGQVVVQGPFYDAKDSTLAVTGGTGRYRRVRGSMRLHAREGGTSYDFVFRLLR